MVFKTLQHYSDGEVVRWIQEPQPNAAETERPAPVLKLLPRSENGAVQPNGQPTRDSSGLADSEAAARAADWAMGAVRGRTGRCAWVRRDGDPQISPEIMNAICL